MHESLTLEIAGNPVPQARHRLSTRHGFPRQYDPSAKYKRTIETLAAAEARRVAWKVSPNDAYALTVIFDLPYPANPKVANLASWNPLYSTKPDIDNLLKLYLDACNTILWHDDQQIIDCDVKKRLSKSPKTVINVTKKTLDPLSSEHADIFAAISKNELDELATTVSLIAHASKTVHSCPREDNRNTLVALLTQLIEEHMTTLKRLEKRLCPSKKAKAKK